MLEKALSHRPDVSQVDISWQKFLPEMIGEVNYNVGNQVLTSVDIAGVVGLAGLFFNWAGDKSFAEMSLLAGASVGFMGGTALYRTLSEVYRQNAIEKAFPAEFAKDYISISNLKSIITDKVNAIVPEKNNRDPLKFKSQPLIPYKKRLIHEFAKIVKSEKSAIDLYDMLMSTSNLKLKKYIIKMLERYGKEYLKGFFELKLKANDFSNDLDKSITYFFASPKRLGQKNEAIDKLKILSENSFWNTAKSVANELVKNPEVPKTLHPFVRLFALRRMKEIISANILMSTKQFIEVIGQDLKTTITKFNHGQKETTYSKTETTTGFEIQPVMSKDPLPLFVDDNEINQIIKFSELGSQDDKPFEIRLRPNVSPIAQLLTFKEVLELTGIPIEQAGVQINFGGIGKRKENILALQRIILTAGRLKLPKGPFLRYGNYWTLSDGTGFRESHKKGEINVRTKLDPKVKRVIPRSFNATDLDIVSEVRAPIGADSFYIFARGLLAAHELANMIRDSEQNPDNNSSWNLLCNQIDLALEKAGLPKVKSKWLRDDWKKFASLIENQNNPLQQAIKDFFNQPADKK